MGDWKAPLHKIDNPKYSGIFNATALLRTAAKRRPRRYLGTQATGGTDQHKFLYELDSVGNITKTAELDGTEWTYAYDARYRLTSATSAEGRRKKWKETYVYDNGDNLLTKTTPIQYNFQLVPKLRLGMPFPELRSEGSAWYRRGIGNNAGTPLTCKDNCVIPVNSEQGTVIAEAQY